MQLHPTRATFQVALAGAALVAFGIATKLGPAIAFGGGILLAVTLGRSVARVAVTRIRGSGFEMVWSTTQRVTTTTCGREIVMQAELRNRGEADARGLHVRAVASSMLDVSISPSTLLLPAASRVTFEVRIRAKRVGRWGLHGIALEVRGTPLGGDGLYEVPLMFANPHGVEVLPRSLFAMVQTARGGRARRGAEAGRPSSLAGDGEPLKELREHVPGDPFKRIAWKASARRGKLLVREMEREDRDVAWLVLDASVELWAGPLGRAPLDTAIDDLSRVAAKHLANGDAVGLVVFASRTRTWLAPGAGAAQASKIAAALASAASTVDSDRCEFDETELALRVAEHLRPLDPRALADVPRGDLDGLSLRAEAMRSRAPFAPRLPVSVTAREQRFRHYLASFGVEVAPRIDGERAHAEAHLTVVLDRLTREKDRKKRASLVHLWAPAAFGVHGLAAAKVRKLKSRRVEVRWTLPAFDFSHSPARADRAPDEPAKTVEDVVLDAVRIRVRASQDRDVRTLRALGIRGRVMTERRPQIEA